MRSHSDRAQSMFLDTLRSALAASLLCCNFSLSTVPVQNPTSGDPSHVTSKPFSNPPTIHTTNAPRDDDTIPFLSLPLHCPLSPRRLHDSIRHQSHSPSPLSHPGPPVHHDCLPTHVRPHPSSACYAQEYFRVQEYYSCGGRELFAGYCV